MALFSLPSATPPPLHISCDVAGLTPTLPCSTHPYHYTALLRHPTATSSRGTTYEELLDDLQRPNIGAMLVTLVDWNSLSHHEPIGHVTIPPRALHKVLKFGECSSLPPSLSPSLSLSLFLARACVIALWPYFVGTYVH